MVSKLPYKLRERWRTIAHDIMERSNQRVLFVNVVVFLEKHVSILSDPIVGDIPDVSQHSHGLKPSNKLKPQANGNSHYYR